ncbi:hypothetical protein BST81_00140 [Leptolyngbya sp. 'hensonii']|uniref:DUF302 domain-containing protein n=1 Tax=Leptolyngbya sp. 'hensonii' TaxID=1922337 RepID=UPI00094F66C6|nr:DUF302 domain-containing protein [Leptolyngbya sp. 'hensonii']OLP20460.1 hypothetical protein BST81_00140 [Leptolyngbya sp. 'hensonii']
MTYHFSKVVDASFQEAITQVTESLKQEGMGILTEIDVQAAFKKKLDIEFHQYKILGACHPQIAYQMIQTDDKAGVLYPCNVVVQEHEDGRVEVSAVDPLMMFLSLHSPRAKEIAIEASQKMQRVIDRLPQATLSASQAAYTI